MDAVRCSFPLAYAVRGISHHPVEPLDHWCQAEEHVVEKLNQAKAIALRMKPGEQESVPSTPASADRSELYNYVSMPKIRKCTLKLTKYIEMHERHMQAYMKYIYIYKGGPVHIHAQSKTEQSDV